MPASPSPQKIAYDAFIMKKDSYRSADLKLYPSITFTESQRRYRVVKRAADIILSALLLLLLSPLFLIVAIIIKANSRGPVLFRQERMGQFGKTILVYKFRTMYSDAPNVATCDLHNPDQYITPVGRFLRVTSIDELPQLINILCGDMSFIGPRPLILSEKEVHIGRMQKGIYYLKPGLTGLAQISGRDLVSQEQKILYDEEYLHSFCMKLDCKIVLQTIKTVLKRDGIAEGDTAFCENPNNISELETCPKKQ
jgi:O-antigen biosynthesis protein WbqP